MRFHTAFYAAHIILYCRSYGASTRTSMIEKLTYVCFLLLSADAATIIRGYIHIVRSNVSETKNLCL